MLKRTNVFLSIFSPPKWFGRERDAETARRPEEITSVDIVIAPSVFIDLNRTKSNVKKKKIFLFLERQTFRFSLNFEFFVHVLFHDESIHQFSPENDRKLCFPFEKRFDVSPTDFRLFLTFSSTFFDLNSMFTIAILELGPFFHSFTLLLLPEKREKQSDVQRRQ